MKTFFSSLLIVFATLFAAPAFAALPAGYTELEYIESTGTQYIDTGIYGTEHHGMEIKYSYPTLDSGYSGRLCGGRTGAGAENAFAYIATSNGTLAPTNNAFYMSSNNGTGLTLVPLDTGIHTASINFSNNQKSYFDGQEAQTGGKTTAYVHQFTTNLFRAYNGTSGWATPARARIYFCKITDSGALVRNLVPAKNSSGVVGMYDLADPNPATAFHTNQGTGEFTAGPVVPVNGIKIATTAYNAARFNPVKTDLNSAVATIREIVTKTINQTAAIASLQADKQTRPEEQCPAGKKCLLVETEENGVIVPHWFPIVENICGVPSGYTCLDYIRSSGTAYIDTGYSPTSQTRIELVAKMDDGAGNVNIVGSGSAESTGASTQALMVINSYTDTEAEIKFGVSGSWDRVPVSMTAKNTFSMSATEFRVNGVVKKTFSGSIANTGNKPFYLFQRWRPEITSATSRVQIYEFNIYENDVLVRHMVPAKQGTTVGMYDTVNDRFYTNAGTGSLTAGPEI